MTWKEVKSVDSNGETTRDCVSHVECWSMFLLRNATVPSSPQSTVGNNVYGIGSGWDYITAKHEAAAEAVLRLLRSETYIPQEFNVSWVRV